MHKIKTCLWSGIIMGLIAIGMLVAMPTQVRVPGFDSGAPSPRIIPGICIVGILICAVILLVESIILKKESYYEFDWKKEKPALFFIFLMIAFTALTIYLGFILAGFIVFPIMLFYCGERKPFIYIYTLAMDVGIYFLFKLIFHISLPKGPLPF